MVAAVTKSDLGTNSVITKVVADVIGVWKEQSVTNALPGIGAFRTGSRASVSLNSLVFAVLQQFGTMINDVL